VGESVGDSDVGLGVGATVGSFVGDDVGSVVGQDVGGEVVTIVAVAVSFNGCGSTSSTCVTLTSPLSQMLAFSSETQVFIFQRADVESKQQFPLEASMTHNPWLVQVLTMPLHELPELPSHTAAWEVPMACRRASR